MYATCVGYRACCGDAKVAYDTHILARQENVSWFGVGIECLPGMLLFAAGIFLCILLALAQLTATTQNNSKEIIADSGYEVLEYDMS